MLIIGGSQGARSINKHFQKNITKYIDKGIKLSGKQEIIRQILSEISIMITF